MSSFRQRVIEIVKAVPYGMVATYGQVALLAGNPRAARQVGAVLHGLGDADEDVPWHRIINASGGISTYKVGAGELQVALLRSEGVEVERSEAGPTVSLRRWQWIAELPDQVSDGE